MNNATVGAKRDIDWTLLKCECLNSGD